MGYSQLRMNLGAGLTAFLLLFCVNFLSLKNIQALNCNLISDPNNPSCASTSGDDTITIRDCIVIDDPTCDNIGDIVISDQAGKVVLKDIDSVSIIGLEGEDHYVVDYITSAINVPVTIVDLTDNNHLKILGRSGIDEFTLDLAFLSGTLDALGSESVAFTGISSIEVDGRGGGDTLTVLGTNDVDQFLLQPGSTINSGTLITQSTQPLPKISFFDLGLSGVLEIDGQSSQDGLAVQGTSGLDQFFISSVSNLETQFTYANPGNTVALFVTALNIAVVSFDGLEGNDVFDITGPFEGDQIVLYGGDNGSGNQLVYSANNPLTVLLQPGGFNTLLETNGGPIAIGDVQTFDLQLGGNDLSFEGFPSSSEVNYTPLEEQAGNLMVSNNGNNYTFSEVTNLTLDTGGNGNTTLKIPGHPEPNEIEIYTDAMGNPVFAMDALSTNFLPATFLGFDLISVEGGADDDEFEIEPLTDTAIIVDGGPHGLGDIFEYEGLNLTATVGDSSIVSDGKKPVAYFNMEKVLLDEVMLGDVPPGGVIEFSTAVYRTHHNDGVATITVKRSGSGIGAVSVDYATSNLSAQASVDYVATSGTLNWAHGDTTSRTFQVPLISRTLPMGEKLLNLSLSNLETDSEVQDVVQLGNLANALLLIESTLAGEFQAGQDNTGGGQSGDGDSVTTPDDGGAGAEADASDSGGCSMSSVNPTRHFGVFLLWTVFMASLVMLRRRMVAQRYKG